MAKMYPDLQPAQIPSTRRGERDTYVALRALPESYSVFYSVRVLVQEDYSRRARTREADFVILHPEHGMLCLEVKGGEKIDHASGSWRWKDFRPMTPQPDEQAERVMYGLHKHLKRTLKIDVPHSWAIGFPHSLIKGRLPPGTKPDQVLDLDAFESPEALEDAVIAASRVLGSGRRLSARDYKDVVETINGKVSVFFPLGRQLNETMKQLWRLDDHQQLALRAMLHGRRRLLCEGGAGTGKTEIALAAAAARARRGERVLLICYTKNLAAHLRSRIEEEDFHGHVEVKHVHGLCRELARLLGQRMGVDSAATTQLLRDGVTVYAGRPERPYIDALIIDEGQDFHPEWVLEIAGLIEDIESGTIILCRDHRQYLFEGRDVAIEGQNLEEILELDEPFLLDKNYRNTRAISSLLNAHIEHNMAPHHGPGSSPLSPDGMIPTVRLIGSRGQHGSALAGLLADLLGSKNSVEPEDIVCLTPWREGGSAELGQKIGGAILTDSLEKWYEGGHILVNTARAFKGLEAPIVIMFDIGDVPTPRSFTAADFYVAASRARTHLFIITDSPNAEQYLRRLGAQEQS